MLNDNNYPGSAGRTAGQPDNNEFIVIKLDEPLPGFGRGHDDDDDHDHDDDDDDDDDGDHDDDDGWGTR